jgi:MYXO-CTERM domain-containing protein
MKFHSITGPTFLLTMFVISAAPAPGGTVPAPDLATAISFGLLGGTISNTGTSIVIGNVGAMTSITGFPPGTATGSVTVAGPVVTQAFDDFVTAYNYAFSDSNTPPSETVSGGLTVSQTFIGNNVYSFSSADVTSTAGDILTFDAQGNSNDIFILKDINTLTIDGPITFDLTGGALANNIYWIIGTTATINPTGVPIIWDGSILAGTSFTMSAGTGGSGVLAGTINGCVFAESGTATDAGETNINGCSASASNTPEPGSAGLAAISFLLGIAWLRRRRSAMTLRMETD